MIGLINPSNGLYLKRQSDFYIDEAGNKFTIVRNVLRIAAENN